MFLNFKDSLTIRFEQVIKVRKRLETKCRLIIANVDDDASLNIWSENRLEQMPENHKHVFSFFMFDQN